MMTSMNPYEEPTSTAYRPHEPIQRFDLKSVLLAAGVYLVASYLFYAAINSSSSPLFSLGILSVVLPCVIGAAVLAWRCRNGGWLRNGLAYSLAPTSLSLGIVFFVQEPDRTDDIATLVILGCMCQAASMIVSFMTIALTRTLIKLANWEAATPK
jgi:hypothetical protein